MLGLWRSLGHREATKRASRRSPRALRDIGPAAARLRPPPLAAPRELPMRFLRAKMKFKETQKSSTELFKSSENDLKIQNVNGYETIEKLL